MRRDLRSIGALLALALLSQSCIDAGEQLDFAKYRGSARLWHDPKGSYHKPWLLFPDIRLDQAGLHEFTIKGLPNSSFGYWFGLALASRGDDAQMKYLSGLGVHCEVEIRASDSDTPLRLGGLLAERSTWQAGDDHARGDFWAHDDLWIEGVRRRVYIPRQLGHNYLFLPDTRKEYRVRITVTCAPGATADSSGGNASVTPVLWGSQDW